jgi:cytochrome c553
MKTAWLLIGVVTAMALPLLARGVADEAQERRDAVNSRPDLNKGAELFQSCAVCHGSSGGGTPDGHVPRIAGQHFSVLVKQLVDYRRDRRWDPLMQYMADQHLLKSAQDIADVAGYASEIETLPESGVSVGSGEYLAQGAQVYASACESCHGQRGEGNGREDIPKVAGQNYQYLVRQIHDAVEGRRPNFSTAHIRLLKPLDYAAIMGVADYLSRIPRPADHELPHRMAAR